MRAAFIRRLKPFLVTPLLLGLTTTAIAEDIETFADIIGNFLFGASIVTDFLHSVCILLGVGFLIYSVVAYRNHRLNPKMVPLDRPILYLFLGVVFTAIPFLGGIVERTTGEAILKKRHVQQKSSVYHTHDIDEPEDY